MLFLVFRMVARCDDYFGEESKIWQFIMAIEALILAC